MFKILLEKSFLDIVLIYNQAFFVVIIFEKLTKY
jgi:hypothetical protein